MWTKTYYDTYIDIKKENKWQDFNSGYSKFCSKTCSNKDPKHIESRMRYQKHKLVDFEEYDKNLIEWQIMQLRGFDKIYDCGNKVFTLQV